MFITGQLQPPHRSHGLEGLCGTPYAIICMEANGLFHDRKNRANNSMCPEYKPKTPSYSYDKILTCGALTFELLQLCNRSLPEQVVCS
jgi:hypothetical protein